MDFEMKKALLVLGLLIALIAIGDTLILDPVPVYAEDFNPESPNPPNLLNALETIQNCKNFLGQYESQEENVSVVAATLGLYNTVRVYENCHLVRVKIADGYAVETWHKTLPVVGHEDQRVMVLSVRGQ